ncbi:MAG: hypothetical protein IT379_29275, partial [Deltaproteobacteria bacterium]|nr:hypothetical protein [Deltaproteobacteria bacterium]
MRRWMLALVLAGISTTACGDDPPQCLLDTDCPLGQRCAEEKCVQRGAPARRDSGTVGEGGVADVGPLPDTGIPPVVDMG